MAKALKYQRFLISKHSGKPNLKTTRYNIVLRVRGDTVNQIIRDLELALAGLVGAGGLNDVSQHSDWVCLACLAKQKELR